jgi:hypothetical protein
MTPDDACAFVGDPPLSLWRPQADEVHVSVAFTWDILEGQRLVKAWGEYYPAVKIGGPAFDNIQNSFTPGMYVKHGVTFTTRGCNNNCPWCLVPEWEGGLREIADFALGWIVQDNNLLQASRQHISRVFDMLKTQRKAAIFSGGLQASLVTDWVAEEMSKLRIDHVFLAADTNAHLRSLEKAIKKLSFLSRRKLRVYVLIGRETIKEAGERLEAVWQIGGLPFAQLFQPPERFIKYSHEWRDLARTWSRPAAMFAVHQKDVGSQLPPAKAGGLSFQISSHEETEV